MLRGKLVRTRGVCRRIDVEERIDRNIRPFGDGNSMPRGPDLDFPQALFDQGVPEIVT